MLCIKVNEVPLRSLKVGDKVISDLQCIEGTITHTFNDGFYEKVNIKWANGKVTMNLIHALLTTVNYIGD